MKRIRVILIELILSKMIKNNEITWWFSEVLESAETDEKAENCVISNKLTSNKQEIRRRAIFLDFQLKKFILSFGCCSADAIVLETTLSEPMNQRTCAGGIFKFQTD